jgi:ABC-type amino acid transport substrate-binding protein
MRRSLKYLFAEAAMVLALWIHAAQAETLFRVCVIEWPPYLTMKDGQANGPVAERINRIAASMNAKASFTEQTRPRCAKEIESGNAEAMFPYGGEIKGLTQSSTSVLKAELGYYVPASSTITDVPESLIGKTVLSALGVYLPPEVLRGAHQMAVSNIKDAMTLMAGGRADFAFGDLTTIRKYYPDAKALNPVLMRKDVGLGFSSDNEDLRIRFDKANK